MLRTNNPSILFVRTVLNPGGPPAHSINGRNRIQAEVELNQKLQRRLWSPRLQIGFDMVPQSVYFPFSNSSFPSNIFFRLPKYSPSISWFVSEILSGDCQKSLYHVHVATSLHYNSSDSCFSCWFILLSSETCLTNSISSAATNFTVDTDTILHDRMYECRSECW
jgi:hypothetical protein